VKNNAIVLPGNYLAALKALTSEVEKREEAEARALEAERTKALIGSKREATAMATASREARRADALEIELDKSKHYATVKRMEMLHHGQKFNWRLLKSVANEMGVEPIDVFDQNYGTVKAWPAGVWMEAYALEIPA
jgi:membrane glycosyltransferase